MSRLFHKVIVLAVVFSMVVSFPVAAQPVARRSQIAAADPAQPVQTVKADETPLVTELGAAAEGSIDGPQGEQKTGVATFVVELLDEPAAAVYARTARADATAATRAQIARIEAAQQQLLAPLADLGATVLFRNQRVYNGIYLRVDAAKLDAIRKLPGVKDVHPVIAKTIDNWHSVPLIGAPELWDAGGVFGGLDGEGVKIGIIDSGLDYMHTDFGGLGTTAVYSANDTLVITDTYNGQPLFPTVKAVGGYDFVGDDYDANPNNSTYQPIPHPDPDPAACLTGGSSADHGTHVAGTAAGYGVKADGTTYTGPYTEDMDLSTFWVGPGVAPLADLYALRVFGCNGSTDVTDQAIEWAVDPDGDGDFSDHLDVINMSLGSSYGAIYDSSTIASDNAALAGVIVVTSAGNAGDVYYVSGSPGIAERAISTAGVDDGAAVFGAFKVTQPAAIVGNYPGTEAAFGPDMAVTGPVTGTLVYPSTQANGCVTFNITNTQLISGNIALIDRGACTFQTKVYNAMVAGATGVIIANNVVGEPFTMGGDATIPPVNIPSMMTDLSTGNLLKANLPGVEVVLTAEFRDQVRLLTASLQDTIYTSSSRGPRRGDSLLKPDLAAPAVTVYSALNHSGYKGTSYNGTSMASPHVAGSMALLRQLHPDWSVEELKALAMNTATQDVKGTGSLASTNYGPGRIGAGRVVLPNAAAAEVVAYNALTPWTTSVSFGAVEVLGTAEATKYIKVANKSGDSISFAVTYDNRVDVPGVDYTITPAQINLPPYGSTLVTVKMTANAALMKHTREATVSSAGGRSWLSEEAGYVVLTPIDPLPYKINLPVVLTNQAAAGTPVVMLDAPTLRVPVHAAPRPAADLNAAVSSISFNAVTGTATIPLTGTHSISTGLAYPTDILSLVAGFELAETSPNDAWTPSYQDNADLKYVGLTNNNRVATGGFVTNTVLYFGISTWGDHNSATAADAEFDIYIDSNRDGTWDYVVWNTNTGSSSSPTDAFATAVYNLSTGAAVLDQYVNLTPSLDTYPFNNNVLILPVSASRLGLNNSAPRFDYQIFSFSREEPSGFNVDATAKHTYSAAAAGLDFTQGSLAGNVWADLPGTNINVNLNLASYEANGSQGALLFHHHNAAGLREEVIDVTTPANLVAITLMHTNDFHGNLEPAGSNPGIARLAYKINQVRNEVNRANTLLLDAGDIMQSSLLSNLKKGEPTIDLYNFVGYDVATYGNHEFDWGQQVLISRTLQADFPFVVSNLVVNDTGNCATAGWTTPVSFTVRPWMTMTVGAPGNQAVIGLLGLASVETPYITIASATEGLCFKDPAQAVAHWYNDVKAAGADVIVVLSHNGNTDGGYGYGFTVYGDQTLARKLVEQGTPANLIIGGHSHTDLAAAQVISGTTVVQAHYAGRKLGRADLIIDTANDTASIKWTRIVVGTTDPKDAATDARVNVWAQDPAYQAQINQVIGFSNVDLVRNYNGDNLMGALVNDSIYYDLNNDAEPLNDVDMVFNNPGGLRADLTSTVHPFTLTYGMLYSVLPFGNATIVGDMTGAQIVELLNQSATLFKGALQVGGVRYKFYRYSDALPGPQPWAWGAYDIEVFNRNTATYEPLVITKTYRIATNEFLAPAGQDGFTPFKYIANYTYWGDMLDGVNRWISHAYSTTLSAYNGPNNNGLPDGRITRNGTDTYGGTATEVVPVTLLHHNDSHGNLLKGAYVGYTQLATLIKQERQHNPARTLLLQAGDNIQGDAMMYYYKTAGLGYAADGSPLPPTMTVQPLIAAFNAMTYTAMTLGNHEFNFGHEVFTSALQAANFPILQANLYDDGSYGIAEVPVQPHITTTLPGPAGDISLAVLGIGNHRVPNYELPSNIPGLTFTDPITETQLRAPALKAANDVVIALTHIGFTENPNSVEVDENVDTNLAAQTTGVDAIIGGHSHTNPATGFGAYKYLPTIVGSPDNVPVIINHAYRYNNTLGSIILGLLPDGVGGYDVVARSGRYLSVASNTPEDPQIYNIVKPYDTLFASYKNGVVGTTAAPIDALNAFITETNAANLQVDASLWKLTDTLGIPIDFHLSGAMTNKAIAAGATPATPYTMTINDMFTLMPYENSLVVMDINGAQLKAILERGFRNYWYYKNTPDAGGYSKYTTCFLDVSAGGVITYQDTISYTPGVDYVVGMSLHGVPIDFTAATTYTVSTVNYLAAGSCNFNNGGVSLWPLNQIVQDTQFYVRDAVIEYVPEIPNPIAPAVEGRLVFLPTP